MTVTRVVLKALASRGVGFSCFEEIESIETTGNRKTVRLRHVLSGQSRQLEVDHCVIERGGRPMDALFHELKDRSLNKGQVEHQALVEGTPAFGEAPVGEEPVGEAPVGEAPVGEGFLLARIGDAVAGRNIHAALYDALRLCKDL